MLIEGFCRLLTESCYHQNQALTFRKTQDTLSHTHYPHLVVHVSRWQSEERGVRVGSRPDNLLQVSSFLSNPRHQLASRVCSVVSVGLLYFKYIKFIRKKSFQL